MLKYTLITGEVIELFIDDILEIDKDNPSVMQEILCNKNNTLLWADIESACKNDEFKFFDLNKLEEDISTIDDSDSDRTDIYLEVLSNEA